jgi:hypothetical protein
MTSDAPCSRSPTGERYAAYLEEAARYRGPFHGGYAKGRTDESVAQIHSARS